MKILIIHPAYWTHYKARIHSALQHQIQQQGLPIELLVVHLAHSEQSRLGLGNPDPNLHQYPHLVMHPGAIEEFTFNNRLRALFNVMHQFKPDVVNVPGYYDPAVVLLTIYAKLRGLGIIMSIDSTEADHNRQSWRETLKRRIVGLADGFFCYGSLAAHYMLRLGATPDQILLRRNAVDNVTLRQIYEAARPTRTERLKELGLPLQNLIYVGRLIDRLKNLKALINAFRTVKTTVKQASGWGLILVGDGEDKTDLEQLAQDQPTIRFIAGQSWQQIPKYLALSDALVLPSYSEPWGLVVNEAMVCGLPVIVSDRCGCAPDLVLPGVNGFTFDPNQPQQLIDAISTLVQCSPTQFAKMGAASVSQIADYSPDAVAHEMLNGFKRIGKKGQ